MGSEGDWDREGAVREVRKEVRRGMSCVPGEKSG